MENSIESLSNFFVSLTQNHQVYLRILRAGRQTLMPHDGDFTERRHAVLPSGGLVRPAPWVVGSKGMHARAGRAAACRAREINSVQHAHGHFEPAS